MTSTEILVNRLVDELRVDLDTEGPANVLTREGQEMLFRVTNRNADTVTLTTADALNLAVRLLFGAETIKHRETQIDELCEMAGQLMNEKLQKPANTTA
jgi:hypothetical protein